MTRLRNIIEKIETSRAHHGFLLLGAWLLIRIFIEGVLEAQHRIGYIPFSYKALVIYFIHYPAFYLSIFLLIVLAVSLLTGECVRKVTNVCALGLGIIVAVPILDALIGGGYAIRYPLRIGPYLLQSLNPFTSIIEYGASPGQRIVLGIVCIATSWYGFLKTRSALRTVLLFFISYFIIILFGGLPTLVAGNRPEDVFVTGGILYSDTQKYASIFVLLLAGALLLYMIRLGKDTYRPLLRSLRPLRASFYGFMGIFGILLALHQASSPAEGSFPFFLDRIGLLIIWLSMAIGFQAAAAINDFFDREGDVVSRTRNPLSAGYPVAHYILWTTILVVLALILAFIVNYVALLIMITFLCLSIIYSVPPVRLKRIPLISNLTLSLAVILAMALGYSVIRGSHTFGDMPITVILPTILGTMLGFTAKDIHDMAGDEVAGVMTLPLFFISRRGMFGRAVMAVIIGISYLAYPIFIPQLLVGSIIASVVTTLFILFTREIREWVFFIFLYLFGAYLVFMLPRLPVLS